MAGEMRSIIRHTPRGNQKFQDLPEPTGEAPYHLSLDKILSANQIKAITDSGSISFHAVGDSGGVRIAASSTDSHNCNGS